MNAFMLSGVFYVYVLCIVCLGMVLTFVVLVVLLWEWREEKRGVKQKEIAVRAYFRYHELFESPRMDN